MSKIICPWIGCAHNVNPGPQGFVMPKNGVCSCEDGIELVNSDADECEKCEPALVCINFVSTSDAV
jgi:hypothetical protein